MNQIYENTWYILSGITQAIMAFLSECKSITLTQRILSSYFLSLLFYNLRSSINNYFKAQLRAGTLPLNDAGGTSPSPLPLPVAQLFQNILFRGQRRSPSSKVDRSLQWWPWTHFFFFSSPQSIGTCASPSVFITLSCQESSPVYVQCF